MTTELSRTALLDALRALRPVVGARSMLPVLSNVALESADGVLTITATNLEQTARRTVAYDGLTLDATTVPAKAFTDFVNGFTGDSVRLTLDGERLRLQAGKQRASLATISRDDFPVYTPPDGDTSFTLARNEFEQVAARVVPFAATDIARPILTGISIEGDGTHVRFAAADNYRIAVLILDHQAKVSVVVPAVAFALAEKVLAGEFISVTIGTNGARFTSEAGDELSTRIIEGQYPNIDPILPATYTTTVLLASDEYAQATKLAMLATSVITKFEETDEGLRVYASEQDRDFDMTLDANFGTNEHESVRFAASQKFANSLASVFVDSSEIEIGYNSALAPIGFRDPDDPTYRAVLMPVRTAVTSA